MDTYIRWWGHAFFEIFSRQGKRVLIDPWCEGNPSCPASLENFEQADLVLVTHDHFDHVGQAAEIVRRSGATLVANVETARTLAAAGLPAERVAFGGAGLNIGGSLAWGGIEVVMTQAFHSSATGSACGYIVRLEDGTGIYHAGDTGIFSSMGLLASLYPIEAALLPIGGVFTMDAHQAAAACRLIRPRKMIPMHYATFPVLAPDATEFAELMRREQREVEVVVLAPGGQLDL
jgi:L-ascorbate metabolism protein UlaG (beta-lactamase superfamily)